MRVWGADAAGVKSHGRSWRAAGSSLLAAQPLPVLSVNARLGIGEQEHGSCGLLQGEPVGGPKAMKVEDWGLIKEYQ